MNQTGPFKTLLVEDSYIFRELLKETLMSRFKTMQIFEAPDGEGILQKVEALKPKLIFMDIKLPGENGLDLTMKIKEKHPNIIVIILTSYDTPEYRKAADEVKANFFLVKGATTKDGIIKMVESILSTAPN